MAFKDLVVFFISFALAPTPLLDLDIEILMWGGDGKGGESLVILF